MMAKTREALRAVARKNDAKFHVALRHRANVVIYHHLLFKVAPVAVTLPYHVAHNKASFLLVSLHSELVHMSIFPQ